MFHRDLVRQTASASAILGTGFPPPFEKRAASVPNLIVSRKLITIIRRVYLFSYLFLILKLLYDYLHYYIFAFVSIFIIDLLKATITFIAADDRSIKTARCESLL